MKRDDVEERVGTIQGQRIGWALVLALVAALVAADVGLVLAADRAEREQQAAQEALEGARQRVPVLLSYDKKSLDRDLARAEDQATGEFRDDYARILEEVVSPAASQRGISTSAEVTGSGVVSGDEDSVKVLVLLTQSTTIDGAPPSVTGSRIEVTMRRLGDDWRIAGLQPV
jgi:Mce-associated membrane protein